MLIVPGAASGQAAAIDSVVGHQPDSFELGAGFDIQAFSGPDGKNPTGRMHIVQEEPVFSLEVTCLAVSGNTAIIGFEGTVGAGAGDGPVTGLAKVVDGGGPGSGLDTFHFFQFVTPVPAPTTCASFPGPVPGS